MLPDEHLFVEKRKTVFRKEEFEYVHVGIVNSKGEMFTTTELDIPNYVQALNAYRQKYGIPFPSEIAALRRYYGLSAAKMSEILGFGTNQYRLYEKGEVPNDSNARVIISIRNKNVFLEYLKASSATMSDEEYREIADRIKGLPEYIQPLKTPDSSNGFTILSNDRITAVIQYFISRLGGVFTTKMNKLLYYVDTLAYKRTGYGITGLEYRALQFGPVPADWMKVYGTADGIESEEVIFPNDVCGTMLISSKQPDMSLFTEDEKQVLDDVCVSLGNLNSTQISQLSHQEKGWIENQSSHSPIDYSYAFLLNAIPL